VSIVLQTLNWAKEGKDRRSRHVRGTRAEPVMSVSRPNTSSLKEHGGQFRRGGPVGYSVADELAPLVPSFDQPKLSR
jgi:hypothetical protein